MKQAPASNIGTSSPAVAFVRAQRLRPRRPAARRRQRGLSGALLLTTVIGFAGMAVAGVWSYQQQRSATDQALAVERARAAALAGLQWGRWQAARAPTAACAAATTLTIPGIASSWRVTVRCTATGTYTVGASIRRTYRIEATACNAAACPGAGSLHYVESVATDWVVRP